MARTNVPLKYESVKTHEGGKAMRESTLKELRRTLSTCMLFEDTFYESGYDIAKRLAELAKDVSRDELIAEIRRAKDKLFLRHAPIWMAVNLTSLHGGREVGQAITDVIKRADELAEIISQYQIRNGDAPLTKQLKVGVARAFGKFDEYQFSKWDRDGKVKLRDAMFLTHPKPENGEREALYKKIADGTLSPADTWEVALTEAHTNEEKKAVWTDLIVRNKLGALALIRNLRNMEAVNVEMTLVANAISKAKVKGILPYQLVSAWRSSPAYARYVDQMAQRSLAEMEKLSGLTVLVVDVSGSMRDPLNRKSTANRMDAAGALATHFVGVCEDVRAFTFSNTVIEVPVIQGFGMIEQIKNSQPNMNTYLARAVLQLVTTGKLRGASRVIVITDEQAQDGGLVATGAERNYIMNVAPYKYGVEASKDWTRINGFSSAVVDWVREEESDPMFEGGR